MCKSRLSAKATSNFEESQPQSTAHSVCINIAARRCEYPISILGRMTRPMMAQKRCRRFPVFLFLWNIVVSSSENRKSPSTHWIHKVSHIFPFKPGPVLAISSVIEGAIQIAHIEPLCQHVEDKHRKVRRMTPRSWGNTNARTLPDPCQAKANGP